MEYIVIGLLVVIVGLLWYNNPKKMKNVVTDSVLRRIQSNREAIAQGVYDKLPSEVKEDIPEAFVKAGVEQVIDTAIEVIEEGIK